MFVHGFAVIGRDDHQQALPQPARDEAVEQAPQLMVRIRDLSGVQRFERLRFLPDSARVALQTQPDLGDGAQGALDGEGI